MDHRWVCLTLFLALLAGMTRGQECQDPLGMESGSIPDESITASSFYNDYMYDRYDDPATEFGDGWDYGAAWYARLNGGTSWNPGFNPPVGEWLQVDLGEMKNVKGTITQGNNNYGSIYVTSYKLQYSTDGTTWTTYAGTDGSEVFPGNWDDNTPVTNLLDNPIGTRYVRFIPQTWNFMVGLRVEILGCAAGDTVATTLAPTTTAALTTGRECQGYLPLGMESGSIPDESITASSWYSDYMYNYYDDPATEYPAEYYSWDFGAPWNARLNGDDIIPWGPAENDSGDWLGEWLQVDLGEMKNVKGTITQGSSNFGAYVTSYKLQYSTDETTWTTYADTDGSEKVFPGNTDGNTPVTNLLDNPIGARYVRFLPQTWWTYPLLRVEILGCAAGDTVATTLAPTTTAALTTGRDVDECAEETDNCSPQATCSDTPDSFTCTCNPGYTGNGVTCTDVDECASNNGGCGQTCTNNVGSFVCSCGTGYILNADGLACDDVDECANNNGGCGQTCTNNVGSFVCSCGGGYILNADGLACDDVDECASNNGGCEGTCTNNVGSFDCACGAGLVLNTDGLACDTCADLYPGLQPSHNFGIYQDQCFWAGNFRTPKLNYMAAKQACQAQGGTLAMIKDEATQTFLSNHLKTISGRRQRRFWIGLDDLNAEKAFLWNDGTPLGEYDLFRSSAPHRIRDCVILYRTQRMARWDIKNCDDRYPYICQLGGNGSK